MIELLKTFQPGPMIAIIIVISFALQQTIKGLLWVFNEFWSNRKEAIGRHDLALSSNTTAIIKLQVQIELLNDVLALIPKMKADIDYAHSKLRDIQNNEFKNNGKT